MFNRKDYKEKQLRYSINKYKAEIATDAAPKLTFLIEKRSCFSL